ncbi:hypothetical protein [Mycobacterium kiyosense]
MLELIARGSATEHHRIPLLLHGSWHGAWCWDEHFLGYLADRGYACHALSVRGARRMLAVNLVKPERVDRVPALVLGAEINTILAARNRLHSNAFRSRAGTIPGYGARHDAGNRMAGGSRTDRQLAHHAPLLGAQLECSVGVISPNMGVTDEIEHSTRSTQRRQPAALGRSGGQAPP